MTKLLFVCGLPRSGKSSYCDQWVKQAPVYIDESWTGFKTRVLEPRVVVAGDDFRKAIHGHEYLPEAEGFVFAAMDAATRALLYRGFHVIIDETCTTENTLYRYLRIDPDAQPVWIDTPEEVCKERAIRTKKEYLLGPIERMAAQRKHLKDNWDEIFSRVREKVMMRLVHDNHV